ncbi:hypothetical protein [Thiolapillus sp.]
MGKRFHNSIVAVLVVALLLLGVQSAGLAAAASMGADSPQANVSVAMEMADHDCGDCKTKDCCALQDCQAAPHCTSFSALTTPADAPVCERRNAVDLAAPDVIVASILVPTIYRPPWA